MTAASKGDVYMTEQTGISEDDNERHNHPARAEPENSQNMNEPGKLQKAVQLTLDAGYQLDQEAFEFLTLVSDQDPTEVVRNAIQRIETSREKRLFIGRDFLEEVMKETDSVEETVSLDDSRQALHRPRMLEGKRVFRCYAKGVEADLKVVDDPSGKISSNGTLGDYLGYFRDRFQRMEGILRRRIDVRGATSVMDAMRASSSTRLKIIGMITDKRESKERIFLTVEDLRARVRVLIPQNSPETVIEKAQSLLLDQVVCLSVIKTRSNLFIADDIILPELAQKSKHRAQVPVYAVLTSDMHVGSTKFQRKTFNNFIMWLNGKYGNGKMREIAGCVKYILIAGDVVDGIGIYPNQIEELAVTEVYEQYKLAANFIEQIPDYIEVVIIPGNHDAVRKALPQPAISNQFLEPLREARKIHSFGNPCLLSLHSVETLLYHGRSLDDVISSVPTMKHEHPGKAMTLLLKSRHLAPVYGGKTLLSPEHKDFLVIERVPDIFHSGHIHRLECTNYRGVLLVNSGCWQEQTEYMRRHGFFPTPGKAPAVNLQTLEVATIPFSYERHDQPALERVHRA